MRSSRRLRVCVLLQYFEVGGIERMVLELGRGLLLRGIDTCAVAYLRDGPLRPILEAAGVETRYIPVGKGVRPELALRVAGELRRGGFHLLHSHHVGPFVYGSAAARLARLPQLHTEHSCELYDARRRRLLGWLMPRLARVVSVSPELTRWRQAAFGGRCETIPNGVHVPPEAPDGAPFRHALGLPPGAFVIGCVARLSPEKDHATLLSAFRILHARVPESRLVLVGDGPERARIEDAAGGLPVTLLGQRSGVESILPAFDVVTLSSVREGLPLALLEGMAFGRPAVATAVGGVGELLRRGGGLAVPPSDPAALARALEAYARDPDRARRDGAHARRLVSLSHDREAMFDRYEKVIRELCK